MLKHVVRGQINLFQPVSHISDRIHSVAEVAALTNHPTGEVMRVTLEAGPGSEVTTLDSGKDSGDNEDAQLNTKTTDDQPAKQAGPAATMEVTPDHPVYVEWKGWLWAENLAVGDRLRRSDGGWAKVLAVERVKLAEAKQVYNFTVKGPHTYFVLEVGVLVHNAGCGPAQDKWFWNYDAEGKVIVGRGKTRADVAVDELDQFYLGHNEKYGPQWAEGMDQVFGRMKPEQVRKFTEWSDKCFCQLKVDPLGFGK